MKPESRKFLWDAAEALRQIQEFVAGQDFDRYVSDAMRRSAVERQFEILGEALNQCARIEASLGDLIPDLPRIIAFRNMLIHGYANVDNLLVWEIATTRTEDLRRRVSSLLQD